MSFQLRITSLAENDISNAALWYNEKSLGLGKEFLDSIELAFSIITQNPHLFQDRYKNVKIIFTTRFPYGIYYIIEENQLIILAVLHTKMDEMVWKDRL